MYHAKRSPTTTSILPTIDPAITEESFDAFLRSIVEVPARPETRRSGPKRVTTSDGNSATSSPSPASSVGTISITSSSMDSSDSDCEVQYARGGRKRKFGPKSRVSDSSEAEPKIDWETTDKLAKIVAVLGPGGEEEARSWNIPGLWFLEDKNHWSYQVFHSKICLARRMQVAQSQEDAVHALQALFRSAIQNGGGNHIDSPTSPDSDAVNGDSVLTPKRIRHGNSMILNQTPM